MCEADVRILTMLCRHQQHARAIIWLLRCLNWSQVYRCVDVGVFEDLAYECVLVSAERAMPNAKPTTHNAVVAEGVCEFSDANVG